MSNKRPNIGVTGPDKGGDVSWLFTRFAIFLQGGKAIRIQPKTGIPEEEIHGLIIGGGADIHPERYGETHIEELFSENKEVSGLRQFLVRLGTILFFPVIFLLRKLFSAPEPGIDHERDELEFDLVQRADEKGIPVLGICRGSQLLNIHFGGTLHQDIANFYTEVPQIKTVWPKKRVWIDVESQLYDILKLRRVWVNALHHQAVKELGEKMKVVAREESEVVQAIEHTEREFIMGVQWHPEYMPQIPRQRHIFKRLVEVAGRYKNSRQEKAPAGKS